MEKGFCPETGFPQTCFLFASSNMPPPAATMPPPTIQRVWKSICATTSKESAGNGEWKADMSNRGALSGILHSPFCILHCVASSVPRPSIHGVAGNAQARVCWLCQASHRNRSATGATSRLTRSGAVRRGTLNNRWSIIHPAIASNASTHTSIKARASA